MDSLSIDISKSSFVYILYKESSGTIAHYQLIIIEAVWWFNESLYLVIMTAIMNFGICSNLRPVAMI